MYRQPIIIFGIVIPLVIAVIIAGISSMISAKMVNSFDTKVQKYKQYQASKQQSMATEAKIVKQREVYQQWSAILEQETFSLLTTNLKTIGQKYPSKEFQQTGSERLLTKAGLASVSAQQSSGVRFNLRGTFKTVQKALLELETRMPNLQLQDLRIDPNTTSETAVLNFQIVYFAWEKTPEGSKIK